MNKSAIKNFAIEARKILIKSAVTEAGMYGISSDNIAKPIQNTSEMEIYENLAGTETRIFGDSIKQRRSLVAAIEEKGFENVMEEVAYTWFNRLIAIRFMEVNDYLPTRVRVLSSETPGKKEPDLVTNFMDVADDLKITAEEMEQIQNAKDSNKYDEAFRLLFIKQCNSLNEILPALFETTSDYTELLLRLSFTNEEGVVRMLVDSVPEADFNVSETDEEGNVTGQVEIIGWLYQYYNTELKDDTFAKLKKNVKITKERIPAATQLFTPDWIVRYMVENSVGRIWIEHLRANDSSIDEKTVAEEFGWKYYLPEAEQEENVAAELVKIRNEYKDLEPQDITCIDPCMGSGHILVYMFDVLMDIYKSAGFTEREAAFSILENNIHGLDIDKRAYQLSYFALMMKARGYNRRFFAGKSNIDGERKIVEPKVYAIEESNEVNRNHLMYFGINMSSQTKGELLKQLNELLDTLKDATEYGSMIKMKELNWFNLREFIAEYNITNQISFETYGIDDTKNKIGRLINIGEILSGSYLVVSTNPPYMGAANGKTEFNNYVKKNYPAGKIDMYSVFMERGMQMLNNQGYLSMITQHSWMFLSSFEKLREIILNSTIVNMAHLGARAFDEIAGEVVQTTAFTIKKIYCKHYKGSYQRLLSYLGESDKNRHFINKTDLYIIDQDELLKISGMPIAYWITDKLRNVFATKEPLEKIAMTRRGLQPGDSPKFVRCWYEVDFSNCSFPLKRDSNKKWVFLNSGGSFRKWFGNLVNVVNWEKDGKDIRNSGKAIIPSEDLYFKDVISWNKISSGKLSVRYQYNGIIPGDASPFLYTENAELRYYLLAFMNSNVVDSMISVISPTLNFEVGNLAKLPVSIDNAYFDKIIELTKKNIEIEKTEWDSYELSHEFQGSPLLKFDEEKISNAVDMWKKTQLKWHNEIRANEESINSMFISIYGLSDEMSSKVEDKFISIRLKNEKEIIIEFMAYAVGCIMGRYSLDTNGFIYAGGEYSSNEYKTFLPDSDGIVPILDEEYFEDDIVGKFYSFVKVAFGSKYYEENIEYIASVLDNGEDLPKNAIRKYFSKNFMKDHCSQLSIPGSGKRPIYWLFDSGKENGFKALIYMHRYDKDTVARVRTDYLHKTQSALENALKNAEYIINTTTSATDRAKAKKAQDKYMKQLAETRVYDQALAYVANQRIEIDLDDGVKHNYELFQNIEISSEGSKKQKINLLAKI